MGFLSRMSGRVFWTLAAIVTSIHLPSEVAQKLGMRAPLAARMLNQWAAQGMPDAERWLQGAQVLRSFFLGHELVFLTHRDDKTTPDLVFSDLRQDVYNLANQHVLDGALMLDVGGHIGITAVILKLLNPSARVVSLEPAPPNHLYFTLNLALNGMINEFGTAIELRPEALVGDSRETAVLTYNTMDTTGASLYIEPAQGDLTHDRTFEVSAATLNQIISELRCDRVFFLKLDCEGCEYALASDLDNATLDRIDAVTGEVHPWIKHKFPTRTVLKARSIMCRRGWKMKYLDCR